MTDKDILDNVDQYAVIDDFGYIVFRSDDDLLNYVYDLLARKESYEVQKL